MLRFAQTCDAIAATTKKLEKTAIVAAYLRSLPEDEAATTAFFPDTLFRHMKKQPCKSAAP